MSGTGQHWGIVGGGMLGLTLALRLAQAGERVTVLEAAPNLGGLADAWEVGTVRWDRHYHVTLLSDSALRGLLAEIGLGDRLRFTTTRTEFYENGRFHPLDNALDYLRFPPLGLVDKVRLASTIVYASRIEDGRALEKTPVETWLTRLSGKRTFERIWRPLLSAKLGENYKRASASFIWAVIRRLYAARRSGLKTEMFGTVEGGYGEVLDAFAKTLAARGVTVLTGTPVQSVRRGVGGINVATTAGTLAFDRVVVTSASAIVPKLVPDLTPPEHAAHEGILYQGLVCASLVLKHPLHGRYLTYIADPEIPFTAVIEMSALTGRDQFAGNTLVYLPAYAPADDPLFSLDDGAIEARFVPGLLKMYPELSRDDIVAFKVSRVRNVLAVSTLAYSAKLPARETSIPGLSVVNSAQIVNGTLNVDETVRLANAAAAALLAKPASASMAADANPTMREAS
jgi:protoporphyrinogen oxidase